MSSVFISLPKNGSEGRLPNLLTDHILGLGRLWGDLIVRARLPFEKYGLSRSCSLIFFKTLIFTLLHVKSAILVAFYYAFKANNPRRIWSHFSGISAFTKNTCYTPGLYRSNSKNLLSFNPTDLYKNQRFENRTFDSVRLYIFFVWVRFSSIAELNRTQSTDWVRFSSIEFDWNSVRLSSIYYAGNISYATETGRKERQLRCHNGMNSGNWSFQTRSSGWHKKRNEQYVFLILWYLVLIEIWSLLGTAKRPESFSFLFST